MKTALTTIVGIALGALLFTVPMAGAANGDGTGPDGKGCPMMMKNSEHPCKKGKMMYQGKGGQGQGKMMHQGKMKHHCKGCKGSGQGSGFVDANGDGVCDHYAEMMGKGGKGNGKGHMMNKGRGKGFVDADGNGICDHHSSNAQTEKSVK